LRRRGRVAALRVPGGGTRRGEGNRRLHAVSVAIYGAKGLAYIKVNDVAKGVEGLQSPILKFLRESVVKIILERQRREGRRSDFLRAPTMPRW